MQINSSDSGKISEYKGVNYIGLIPLLTKAIQEQQEEISQLKQEVKKMSDATALKEPELSSAKTINVSGASLMQNTPNPFNNTTNIQFNIPSQFKTAQLIIIDANGTVVKQIALQSFGKGTINVNADNLSSGTYTYSLLLDGINIVSKQMIVEK